MKQPQALTLAMVRNPAGGEWRAQLQLEYKDEKGTHLIKLSGANPFEVFDRTKTLLTRKFISDHASQ